MNDNLKDKEIEDTISNLVDPLILEICLYKNNYVDRLLITELKQKAHTVTIPGMDNSSFFVKIDDIEMILNNRFKKDLQNFDATPYNTLNQSVTSVYFLDSIIKAFGTIKYFRINISDSSIYTRKTKDTISFDYRIIHSRIDLAEVCSDEALVKFKNVFKELGYFSDDPFDKTPYVEISVRDFLLNLRDYKFTIEEQESEEFFIVDELEQIFGTKLEKDDSIALVILVK